MPVCTTTSSMIMNQWCLDEASAMVSIWWRVTIWQHVWDIFSQSAVVKVHFFVCHRLVRFWNVRTVTRVLWMWFATRGRFPSWRQPAVRATRSVLPEWRLCRMESKLSMETWNMINNQSWSALSTIQAGNIWDMMRCYFCVILGVNHRIISIYIYQYTLKCCFPQLWVVLPFYDYDPWV